MKTGLSILILFTIYAFNIARESEYAPPFDEQDFIKIQRDFGYKILPVFGPKRFNKGIVFQLKKDAKILSIQDGVVLNVCDTCERGYGNRVEIKHNDSISVTYYHLGEINKSSGQNVTKGEVLGLSGNSGLTVVNGLGFMVKLNDSIINPKRILSILEKRQY